MAIAKGNHWSIGKEIEKPSLVNIWIVLVVEASMNTGKLAKSEL